MLHIQTLRDNPGHVAERLAIRHFDASGIIQEIIDLDTKKREARTHLDQTFAESKKISKDIADLFKVGKREEAEMLKQKSQNLKDLSKELSENLNNLESNIKALMVELPNLPHRDVPKGVKAANNQLIYNWGEIPDLSDKAMPHWDIVNRYNLIDFDLGSKVSGAGFPFYIGYGAKLQRALISFFLDEAIDKGYLEYQPPLLVNEDSGFGTGQLPDKDGQMYSLKDDNLYLIPTAEVPLTNIFRNVILKEELLPLKITAASSCFRREAGSYGKDVRGLNRLHQFEKVEIVQVTRPEKSYEALEEMNEHVAALLKKLNLPFRLMRLCGGDMSFAAAMTYDFEVYSAAQKRWLEVSSVSNFETFQANRMKMRFKDENGKSVIPHTLNGSALALPRIIAALLENNQIAEGVIMPKVLKQYTGFDLIPYKQ